MADIKIACISCGKEFEVSDAAAGKNVFCPGCGKSVKVEPVSGRLKTKIRVNKGKFCPNCGAPVSSEDGVCRNCEELAANERRRKPIWPAALAVAVIVLISAGAFIYIQKQKTSIKQEGSAPDATPEPETLVPEKTDPVSTPDREPEPPAYSAREEEVRRSIKEKLDRRAPEAVPGEKTDLRLSSGIVYTGIFVGLKDNNAVIRRYDKQEILIPLDELDSQSRAKCDPEYRLEIFEDAVQKQLTPEPSPF